MPNISLRKHANTTLPQDTIDPSVFIQRPNHAWHPSTRFPTLKPDPQTWQKVHFSFSANVSGGEI
jgi:hypothetical protein